MQFSAGLAHFFFSFMEDAWVSSYKETDRSWPPLFRTIRLQQRDHSFKCSHCFPSVAVMAMHMNVLQKPVFWVSYMRIYVLFSLIIVTVMSPKLVHIDNCNLLLFHWPSYPHPFFLISIKTFFYNSVRLAQTLLDRNMRVCSSMMANRHSKHG